MIVNYKMFRFHDHIESSGDQFQPFIPGISQLS